MAHVGNSFLVLGKSDSNRILKSLEKNYGSEYLQTESNLTPKEILDSFPWPEEDFKFFADCYERLERAQKKE